MAHLFHRLLSPFSSPTKSSLLFPTRLLPRPKTFSSKSHLPEHVLVPPKDEQAPSSNQGLHGFSGSSTIAAIVTSLSGPPSAVGVVGLSGPSAVDVAAPGFSAGRAEEGGGAFGFVGAQEPLCGVWGGLRSRGQCC